MKLKSTIWRMSRRKLNKKQRKEEQRLKRELEAKRISEERVERLRVEQEANENAKLVAMEKKRHETERLELLEEEHRRRENAERSKREEEERKERLALEELLNSKVDQIEGWEAFRNQILDTKDQQESHLDGTPQEHLELACNDISKMNKEEFKLELLKNGYSIGSKGLPSRILFDIVQSEDKNGESDFFFFLICFIQDSGDLKYHIAFDPCGNLSVNDENRKLTKAYGILKKFFLDNRIAWRDWTVDAIIAAVEEEPRRTERFKMALRTRQARNVHGYVRIRRMINRASREQWRPLINGDSAHNYKLLCKLKSGMKKFPPKDNDVNIRLPRSTWNYVSMILLTISIAVLICILISIFYFYDEISI